MEHLCTFCIIFDICAWRKYIYLTVFPSACTQAIWVDTYIFDWSSRERVQKIIWNIGKLPSRLLIRATPRKKNYIKIELIIVIKVEGLNSRDSRKFSWRGALSNPKKFKQQHALWRSSTTYYCNKIISYSSCWPISWRNSALPFSFPVTTKTKRHKCYAAIDLDKM